MRAIARLVGGAALLSCSSAPIIHVVRASGFEYPAKRSPFEVALLREPLVEPVLEIATLSAEGGYHQTTDQVLATLREHAALLGADALLVLRETYRPEPVLRTGRYRGELYGLPDPPSAIPEGPEPGLLRRPWVEARAIRYAPR
ncbi:MAG TPA: hypothetical protein VFI25_05240 [Planctomycetota bacterium]|jgi:hypothetical protein|nr:hypothetical protein [Planctomycetota bacterium]